MFFNVTRHRTPSYDFAPNPDKQWILRWLGKMKPVHHRFTDMLMTKRLQTLQSVDEAVEKVFSELVALDQIDNTYIFYTSDHGYHLGQFGLIKGEPTARLLNFFCWVEIRVNCYLLSRLSLTKSGIKNGHFVVNHLSTCDGCLIFLIVLCFFYSFASKIWMNEWIWI